MGRLGIISWNVMILYVFFNNSLPRLRPRLLHNEFESSICAQLTCSCCKFGTKLKLTFQRVYLRKWNCVCGILFWVVALFLQIRTSFLSLKFLERVYLALGNSRKGRPLFLPKQTVSFPSSFVAMTEREWEWDTEQETIKSGNGRSISTSIGSIEMTFISSGH